MNRPTNNLSVAGMILGILALLFSFIPCMGILSVIPAIIGLILGIMGYRRAKEDVSPTTMGLVAIITSILALIISILWGVLFAKAGADIGQYQDLTYESCDALLADYETTTKELDNLKNSDDGFGVISQVMDITQKIAAIEKNVVELNCHDEEGFTERYNSIKNSMEE